MKNISPTIKKKLKAILPDINEHRFIEIAVEAKIKAISGTEFFAVSEKIRKGVAKKGSSVDKILAEFKD